MPHALPIPLPHALISAVALALLPACHRSAPPPPSPPTVTVAHPLVQDVTVWDVYTGRLDAVDFVNIQPRVSGYIDSAPFQEGGLVKQGDILFVIDVRPYQAQLDNARGLLTQSEAQLQLAKDNLVRGAEAATSGALSLEELDTRRQTVNQNQGTLAAAQAAVALAQLNVEWCKVTAPVAGRVGRKLVTPGNLVIGGGPGSAPQPTTSATGSTGGGGGTLLTTITSVDPIYCYFEVDERAVLSYRSLILEHKLPSARDTHVPCSLALANQTEFSRYGYLDFVNNQVNPSTGTLLIRGVFDNPDGYLSPGYFARVRVATNHLPRALLVPDAAINTDQNRKYLLIVDSNHIVHDRPVTLGPQQGTMRVITEGLAPNDQVVINGLLQARPGQPVTPTETTLATPPSTSTPAAPAPSTAPTTPAPDVEEDY